MIDKDLYFLAERKALLEELDKLERYIDSRIKPSRYHKIFRNFKTFFTNTNRLSNSKKSK
jgi:intergrase/recombinase